MNNFEKEQKDLFNRLALNVGELIQIRKPRHFRAGVLKDVSMSPSTLGITVSDEYVSIDLSDKIQITVANQDKTGFKVIYPIS